MAVVTLPKWRLQQIKAEGDGVNSRGAIPAGVNIEAAQDGVNKRKADRHRPGYMRDYMRRKRAAMKGGV
jgi:hypothetical protein